MIGSHGNLASVMRRIGAVLAVAGLLAQAGLLMLHRPPSAAPMRFEHAAHLDVSLPRHHHHASAPQAPDRGAPAPGSPHCPICFALHLIGGFVPPAKAEVAPPAFWTAPAVPIIAESTAAARWLAALPQPRGPPRAA